MDKTTKAAQLAAIYSDRSPNYDDDFHKQSTRDYVTYTQIKAGQKILDLACGTGLLTLLEAEATGPTGKVVGIDLSEGMMSFARSKAKDAELEERIEFINHDVTELDDLKLLEKYPGGFDLITCASAFVLLPDRFHAMEQFASLLAQNGKIVIDTPVERSYIATDMLAKAGSLVGESLIWDAGWITGPDSVKEVFESAGLECEVFKSRIYRVTEHPDGEKFFEEAMKGPMTRNFGREDIKDRVKKLFLEEFDQIRASEGRVADKTELYIAIGKKTRSPLMGKE